MASKSITPESIEPAKSYHHKYGAEPAPDVQKDHRYSHPARKYDRRQGNGNYVSGLKRGPKPKYRKEQTGANAIKYLREIDEHKSPVQMFTEAVEAKAFGLAWQIRQDLEARALGRPYVAINPESTQRHEQADISRIAIAIKSLNILQTPETPALTKKRQALTASTTIDAQPAEEPVTE